MIRVLRAIVLSVPLLAVAATVFADATQYRLQVKGLACPFCAYGIEKELQGIDGVTEVDTHIKDGAVIVTMEDGATLDESTAKKAVEAAGFSLGGFRQTHGTEGRHAAFRGTGRPDRPGGDSGDARRGAGGGADLQHGAACR